MATLIVVAGVPALSNARLLAKIEAIEKAGGTPPVVNKGGRPKGIPVKVTLMVKKRVVPMKGKRKPVAHIPRELNLSRQLPGGGATH
ncbi:hypothetical protein J0H58_26035 [bacterium]|nr:hypothetical protein [bacterium]